MKRLLSICLLLLTVPALGQLNNSDFDQPVNIDKQDSGVFALGINTLGFTKNNEYFNKIADGYTLFGYQVNPYVSYQPLPSVKFNLGVYLQKDFGANGYQTIMPTYSFKYIKDHISLIFGTLEGSTSHRLIEPIYDFEKVLIDRLENGLQVKIEKQNLFVDGWVDWQKMIFEGDPEQERVTGGLSVVYKIIDKDDFHIAMPLQMVVFHQGGQIDDNPDPLQTLWNSAVGTEVSFNLGNGGWLRSLTFQPYYVYYKDFSFEKQSTFEDGSGIYLNLAVKTNSSLEVMASYWKGHEFISIMGGQLYPSVSSNFKTPFHIEKNRELLILRFFHKMQLAKNLSLETRFEPFYDLGNQKFEFSHGFYLNYTTDFRLNRKR